MKKARELILKVFNLLMKPEMRILPGHLAFYIVMTIIPLVALLVTLAAALSISVETIRVTMADTIPESILKILDGIVAGNGINFNMVVFYFSAFLLASNGTYSMINISNEIYKLEPRDVISRRLKAILMIFILVGLFLFLKYVDYREWDTMCKWICNICSLLPALWGLLSWFGLIPSKINIINLLSRGISGKITVWINK